MTARKQYDEIGQIMAYEQGELDAADTVELFSHLVANGHAWSLQGHYGRVAVALIENGVLARDGKILRNLDAA